MSEEKVRNIPYGDIQDLREKLSNKTLTVAEGLNTCRKFRDKYQLTDKETLDIANRRN